MKGHGPFSVTLQGGEVADFPRADDTFEIQGALITALETVGGKGEDTVHVYKQWRDFTVAADNVE
jgi:hypothetical protein